MSRKKRRKPNLPVQAQANLGPTRQSAPVGPQAFQARITGMTYSGPIPPPEIMRGFEELLPGSADRILVMAEKQEAHRHTLEIANVRGNLASQRLGQLFALIIALAAIGCGTFLLYTGHSLEGFGTMFPALAGFAGIFIYGRRKQEQERAKKLEDVSSGHK